MKKAVITGMGCVSGLGADVASTWASLLAGRSAIIQKTIAVKGLDEYQFEGRWPRVVPMHLRNS